MNYTYLFVDNLHNHSYKNGLNELKTSIMTFKRIQKYDTLQIFGTELTDSNIDYFKTENIIFNKIKLSRNYGKSDTCNPINILVEKIIQLMNFDDDKEIVLMDIDTSSHKKIPEDFFNPNCIVFDAVEYPIMQWRNLDKILPQVPWNQFDVNFNDSFMMYNTGVIYIPKKFRKELCEKALQIVDYLNQNFEPEERYGNKLDEQIALSIVCHDAYGRFGYIKYSSEYIHHHWRDRQNGIEWWKEIENIVEESFKLSEINLDYLYNLNISVQNSLNLLPEIFYQLQKVLNPQVCIEVGAYESEFCRHIKKTLPNVECFALEANLYNYEYFNKVYEFENNGIHYLNIAISDIDGEVDFYFQEDSPLYDKKFDKIIGNNSILIRNEEMNYSKSKVKSLTLDTFCEQNSLLDELKSIWIDVEGANKNVLQSSLKTLENILSIFIEVEEKIYWKDQWLRKDVVDFLQKNNFIPIARDFYNNFQYNVIFLNKKILQDQSVSNKISSLISKYLKEIDLNDLIPKNPNNTTLITGLWNINRENLNGIWNRNFDQYIDRFLNLLQTDNNLIIFGDEKLKEIVFRHREHHNTQFILLDLSWFKKTKHYSLIQKIRTDEKWINQKEWLKNSPQASLEMYNPIVMSKMHLMEIAIKESKFNVDYFYWIDGGIRIDSTNFCKEILECIPNYSEFFFISFPYVDTEVHGFDTNKIKQFILDEPNMVSRGGFWGGKKDRIKTINLLYTDLMYKTLSEGFMGTEESLFTILTYKNSNLIDFYKLNESDNGDPTFFFTRFKEEQNKNTLFQKVKKSQIQINKLPISIGILSWKSNQTLRNTLNSYQKNGLFDIIDNVILFFQEISDEDRKLAKEYNIPFISTDKNIGIGNAFVKLIEASKENNILLLEHDWELTKDIKTTFIELKESIELLNTGYDCIRLRNVENPGYPLYSQNVYQGNELNHYDPIIDLTSPHLFECRHWIKNIDEVFPDKIQKENDYFVTTSRWSNFTNNPCIYKKDFYLEIIDSFKDKSKLLENDISYWWSRQNFKIAWRKGLFTHNDIDKYKTLK